MSETLARKSVAITGAPESSLRAANDGSIAFQLDLGSHAVQFLRMHKAVLEDRFSDDADAISDRHENHHLGLQIGWKSRIGQSRHIDAFDLAVSLHSDAVIIGRQDYAGFRKLDQKGI